MNGKFENLKFWQEQYPEKFKTEREIFSNIRRGDKIFVATACGEPQYLVNAMIDYVSHNPKAFADAEIMQVWTLGLAPYTDEKYNYNFRHNSFFVGNTTRESVNEGFADYTPIFLSRIPKLFRKRMIPIDVALIQVSVPDKNGYMSLGVSVDITKSAIENAPLIIAQINPRMPRVHGNTFLHIKDINYLIPKDEKILEFEPNVIGDVADKIGNYVAQIVNDGDTIQVGYGSIPNAIIKNLSGKKNLGIHTELLTQSMVELIKTGVVNNSKKNIDKDKTVAAFCMGTAETYDYIHDNPTIEFHEISYTNNPLVIAQLQNMTSINSALQLDLTGQATAESINSQFYSGIGGSSDFMRGALIAPGGKTILAIQSTANDGQVSRIIPLLESGAGVTLNRGDLHYVVTEYGIAYINGKNIRERAMDLIAISHPKFRPELIKKAKELNLIYKDQAFIPGKKGEYPGHLETVRTTTSGLELLLRPIKINDEEKIKDFFYSLSDQSFHRRFMSSRRDMPHYLRQEYVVIDYTKELVILATIVSKNKEAETVVGMGQLIREDKNVAEVAFAVNDNYHNMGIGSEILSFLTVYAKKEGLQGFTAEVLVENKPMLHVFQKQGFDMNKKIEGGLYRLVMRFTERPIVEDQPFNS